MTFLIGTNKRIENNANLLLCRYLSPASEDFMGLNLEQYRGVLDAACPEKEPKPDCFDELYNIIHKTVEKARN